MCIWLCDSAGQRRVLYRRRPALTRDQQVAIELVLVEVHPGNLGTLPPSPQHLLYKAYQIGLLTDREWFIPAY